MRARTVEIQSAGNYLHVVRGHLKICQGEDEIGSIPLADIGLLIVSHPATVFSSTVITRLIDNGAEIIICGNNFQPCGTFLPVNKTVDHYRRLQLQSNVSEPLRKNLWSKIVEMKIKNQTAVLSAFGGDPGKLSTLHKSILSGDSSNIEAQAAQFYWPRLMGREFRRNRDLPGVNALLNYGYTILRGATARAILAAGLSPAVPLHHSGLQNPTALTDDLMEPFRPIVDLLVRQLSLYGSSEVNAEAKTKLVGLLTADIYKKGSCSTLTQQLMEVCWSLIASFEQKKVLLDFPHLTDSISSILEDNKNNGENRELEA